MKKLSLVMSMILVLTGLVGLFAIPSSAADYAADTVAVVNGRETKLEELQDAIDYSTGGGVFEIVKDFAIDTLIFEGMDGVTVKWEIKGNGHTITSTLDKLNNAVYVLMLTACNVTVSDLTIVTPTSGVAIVDGATVELKNVNVYSGGTKPGLTVEAGERESYASINNSGLNSTAVHIKATTGGSVTIDGGVYKAYGVSGVVLRVERGNAVVKNGTFVGEDCSFVSRVYNQNLMETMEDSGASLTVYDGLFIKPITNKKAGQKANADANPDTNSDGCVIRADAGGVLNIYGGKYASFAGVATLANGTTKFGTQRDFVLLAGISNSKPTCKGFINIYGGDFYSFMTNDCNGSSTQLIGNYSGSATEVNDPEYNKIVANIYGGNFYTTNVQREVNIRSVVDAATDSSVRTIQRLPGSSYTATTTSGQTVELYGRTFTDVTKYSIAYKYSATNPDASAKIKVENKDGTVYYTDDIQLAVNAGAKDGATVTLLDNISVNSLYLYNRNHDLTIDGNGKTLTCAGTYGIKVYSGDVTIKNLKLDVKDGSVAIQIAKEEETVDSFALNLVVDGCTLTTTNAAEAVKNLGVLEGSVKFTNTTAGGTALTIDETYEAPEAVRPVLDGDPVETDPVDTETDDTDPVDTDPVGTDPVETTPDSADDTSADTSADTDGEDKGGCGSAIGMGAIAVLAISGAACCFASKKRED